QEGRRSDVVVYDGSGLSVLNRVSAGGIIEVLALMAESPMWDFYWETLPEAGVSPGLRRMQRTGAERNLRAKTGTIDRVSALSGYVTAANGERLAFSIIANNVPSTWMAKRAEDAIGARLATFERPLGAPADDRDPGERAIGAMPPSSGGVLPAPVPQDMPSVRMHTIRSGETLSHLASRYGVTIAAIERANPGLNPNRIRVGQSVRIPSAVAAAAPDQPQAAQPPAQVTQPPASPPDAGTRTHTIRRGDTLDGIAR